MTPERLAEIDNLLAQMSPYKRGETRWCEADRSGCACLGCINRNGGLGDKGVTKAEWLDYLHAKGRA